MSFQVSHHLLLCATSEKSSCCNYEDGIASWNKLKKIIKDLGLDNINRPQGVVLRSKVDCLRVCKDGPILLIWPDGIWYRNVNETRIEVIIQSHLMNGMPLSEWIIKETPLINSG